MQQRLFVCDYFGVTLRNFISVSLKLFLLIQRNTKTGSDCMTQILSPLTSWLVNKEEKTCRLLKVKRNWSYLSKALWTKIGIVVVKQQLLKLSQNANASYNPSFYIHSLIRAFKKSNRQFDFVVPQSFFNNKDCCLGILLLPAFLAIMI